MTIDEWRLTSDTGRASLSAKLQQGWKAEAVIHLDGSTTTVAFFPGEGIAVTRKDAFGRPTLRESISWEQLNGPQGRSVDFNEGQLPSPSPEGEYRLGEVQGEAPSPSRKSLRSFFQRKR
jgi:hypothetical protein